MREELYSKKKNEPNYNREIIWLGLSFLVLFTAFAACQALASKMMEDLHMGNLGILNQSTIYGGFALSGLYAEKVFEKCGAKRTLFFASMFYVMWVVVFIIPCLIFEKEGNIDSIRNIVKVANLGTGALVGLAAGPLWVSSQAYVSLCANESNKG